MKRKNLLFTAMLMLLQIAVFAQGRVVTGTVKDSKTNETLPGVTIVVEGTTTATVTNEKGNFTINVEGEGKKLIFSSVGYVTKIVPADQDVITVAFDPNTTLLKETVVTALGVSKETKSLGYSVSSVSGDDVRRSGESNVIEGLAAKAPGVNVTGSGGTPGASSKITLRGNSSFTSNQPLIVVDGVPIDNSTNSVTPGDAPFNVNLQGVNESNRAIDLNPEDIETVTVLKGPAAAALYGSRAGNGAIIYTTKRGKAGKGIGATYSTSVEIAKVSRLPELQETYAQGSGGVFSKATPSSWGPTVSSLGIEARNPYDDFFKTGYTYNNNIAVYGGNDNTSLRLGVGNTSQTGIVPNTGLKRTTVRLTTDSKLTNQVTAGGTIDYSNTQVKRAQNGSNLAGVMLALTRTPVSFDMRDYINGDGTQNQYYAAYDNPLFTAYKNPYTDQTNRMLGNVYLDYKPLEFLDFTWKVGTDVYNTSTQQIYAINSLGNDNSDGSGQINKSSNSVRNLYTDLLMKFSKEINKDFGFDALLGYNFVYDENEFLFARGRQLQVPDYYNLNNAAELYSSNAASYQKNHSVFLDATLSFRRMLYLTLTGRNEWNSAFGKNGKSFFYPKADVAWVFSEAFKMPTWFSFGKARIAYSNVGIAPMPYSDRTYYNVPFYTDGFTNGNSLPYLGQSGLAVSNILGNGDLKPERVVGIEGGLDLRFFTGRLTFEATVYHQTSKDLLINQPVAASSGYLQRTVNAGEMVNKGVELALGSDVVHKDNFNWNITVSWSKNISKVTKLTNGVEQFSLETGFSDIGSYAIVGQPYGVFYGTVWKRNGNGDLLLDADGLPQIEPIAEKIGNPNPDWLMNVNNTFTYKAWNFGFLWDIRKGGDIWNGTRSSLNYRGKTAESEDREGTYTIEGIYDEGTPNAGQASTAAIDGFTYYAYYKGQLGAAENSIEDGSWIRLRSVSLSYRFDLTKMKNEKKYVFKYVELGVSGRNLLLFTKYHGVDPETSLTGAGSNIIGYDYFNNPGTKSVFFNLKVGI
jgi:TonB-linked SusC/RagA family outer membrane protein